MVSGLVRAPSPSPLLSLPSQSAGERYVGTPSSSNFSRGATPPSLRVEAKEAATKSGSVSRTFSKAGWLSESRGTRALALASPFMTGSVQVAVPAIRSARPRESMISVVPWFRDTARFGGDGIRVCCPQLCRVRPVEVAAGSEGPVDEPPQAVRRSAPPRSRVERRTVWVTGTQHPLASRARSRGPFVRVASRSSD
ncbi:hypothetical protein SALBM311S_10178 [Streptomyces alboniger]